jgi:aryl-alcohol dehydrogenase-like predicted oxidoreductase
MGTMALPTRTLGKTGITVSALGFGAAPTAFLKTEADATAKLVDQLLDAGVTLIDTATSYPGSEAFIGEHLSKRRKDFTLVSKCGGSRQSDTTGEPWSAELVASSVDRALRLMKTDYIDVMLLHSCDLATLQKGDALGALVAARDAGKVKHIGYSGDNDAAGHACTLREVAVVETSINYVDQANIDLVLTPAHANKVGIIAKRPVANAAWKGSSDRAGIYVNYTKDYVRRHQSMALDISEFGFSAAQWPEFALRFTLSFPEVSTAIVGTTNPANAMANLEHASKGPLEGAIVERVRAKFRSTTGSASWTGQT